MAVETRKVTGHIEFDEAAFPRHDAAAVAKRVTEDAVELIGVVRLCPYCRGRGDFAATLHHPTGDVTELVALCGQCMGTGYRDEADATALVARILEDVAAALRFEAGIVYGEDGLIDSMDLPGRVARPAFDVDAAYDAAVEDADRAAGYLDGDAVGSSSGPLGDPDGRAF